MKVTVCQAHELADGELRQVRVGNTPVLLVNYDGEIRRHGGVLFSLWGTSRPRDWPTTVGWFARGTWQLLTVKPASSTSRRASMG